MPVYECNEHQFFENLRRLIEAKVKFIVNRLIAFYDDGRYGPSHLPDSEFQKYSLIAKRTSQRSTVYASKPFLDDFHRRFYEEGSVLHSARYPHSTNLSIPYLRVEYSFTIWGETYRYEFDVLYEPEIKLERRNIGSFLRYHRNISPALVQKGLEGEPVLVYTLSFKPPKEEMLRINLPPSVIVFDVRRMLRM